MPHHLSRTTVSRVGQCADNAGNCADVDLRKDNNLLLVIKLQVLQGDAEEIIKVGVVRRAI
jgi:hypothetical protein